MTVHDDLATLRLGIEGGPEASAWAAEEQDALAALDRVEAEIARLLEQATQDRATILLREAEAKDHLDAWNLAKREAARLREQLTLAIEQDYCTLCGKVLAEDGLEGRTDSSMSVNEMAKLLTEDGTA